MSMGRYSYLKITPAILGLFLLLATPQTATALGLGDLIGGGGGQPVRIISDISEPARTTAIRTTLIAGSTEKIASDLNDFVIKEMVKDPGSWNMAKQLQQQLTAETLKYLGGQQPGQNGEVPFVQNYSEYYKKVRDEVVGNYLFTDRAGDSNRQCNPEAANKVITAAYNSYRDQQQRSSGGGPLRCGQEVVKYNNLLDQILGDFVECRDNACAYFAIQNDLEAITAAAIQYERDAVNNGRGFKPQRVCSNVQNGDGQTRQRCEIVNPPSIAADAASFQVVEMPGLSLLNVDEFDEVISNLMTNLTNQAINGLTGILGLSGNPNYGRNIFGQGGNLSYADALAKDDLSKYQSGGGINPIAEALKNEREYNTMQKEILATIKALEDKLAANKQQFSNCFDMALTADLKKTKDDSTSNLNISSTTLAVLINLDQQYASSTNSGAKNAILTTFTQLKNQGLFRTAYQNRELKLTFIEFTFAQWVDRFKYDMALKRKGCGGSFDYDGVLPTPTSTPTS